MFKPKFWNCVTLPVLHIASAQKNSMGLLLSKKPKIVFLLTLRVMVFGLKMLQN